MKIKFTLLVSIYFLLFSSCSEKEERVTVSTPKGDIIVKLYNETPKHRDNFIKLTEDKFFDGILFHRVINEFMIQGGDPESKNATSESRLGNGGPGYKIDAEINTNLFHKKGALSAARQGDRSNPERKSSGSQFYIVQGKIFTNEELDKLEEKKHNDEVRRIMQKLLVEKRDSMMLLQKSNKMEDFAELRMRLEEQADMVANENRFVYSIEAREIYTTIGGTPHLDGAYTVFGEVTEGLEIVDSIAKVETNHFDRPIEDITMEIQIVD